MKIKALKTFVFCTCYVDNGHSRHHKDRYLKWMAYYSGLKGRLGADYLFLIDDGSLDVESLAGENVTLFWAGEEPKSLTTAINIVKFKDNLGRSSVFGYPGWWRSFTYALVIARQYNFRKIIHIESDFFVLTGKLFDYLQNMNSGWAALFSAFYGFPESAVQVICQSDFVALNRLLEKCRLQDFKLKQAAELYLPFTIVNKDFKGDRIGEYRVLHHCCQLADGPYDYIGQIQTDLKVPAPSELLLLCEWLNVQIAEESTHIKEDLAVYFHQNDLVVKKLPEAAGIT